MSTGATSRTEVHLGTVVTVSIVGASSASGASGAIERAFRWFRDVEARCSRFDPNSELSQLTRSAGAAAPASDLLFEAVRFAVAVAEDSGGAFDPTVGHAMETRGFNREHRSGRIVRTAIEPDDEVSYRDVELDAGNKTITLRRPLLLDLGAVVKGLAIDMAARELLAFRDFAIDAGGDLYLGGKNAAGKPWSVGIRHPRLDGQLIDVLRVSDAAVCTSGDYERQTDEGHHILDPRTGEPANALASASVVARTAMLADAVATAAFVLGPVKGIEFCTRLGLRALLITENLDRHETPGLRDE